MAECGVEGCKNQNHQCSSCMHELQDNNHDACSICINEEPCMWEAGDISEECEDEEDS